MDIAAWLRDLGLERYESAFRENEIDAEVLPQLTEAHLATLGVPLGPRLKLLKAIAALRQGAVPSPAVEQPSETPVPAAAPSAAAERRQLTVMFCDLVGSTALSARLDPEDLRAVIGAYHRCAAAVIEKSGGFVAKYMGDGVLAYFGYPRADEHDAERAVRAGLALVGEVTGLDTAAGVPSQVRVGIATGLVVVGDLVGEGEARERGVVGETPNLAARLQALAEPSTVVIAPSTRRLTGGLFDYEDLGAIEIKGLATPIVASRVLRESAAESRFEALRATATPLVGRDEELAMLERRWQQVKSGEGCVVLVSGEPGIGKSRLVATLHDTLAREPHLRLRYFCSPYYTDSALYPFTTQLERAAGFTREDGAEAKLDKLEAVLAQATDDPGETAPLLAALLSLPTNERYPALDLTPQRRKELTLRALLLQLEGLARKHPVLMVFEDAHWIDPTSQELLDFIIERVRNLPVLLIVTFRPEFQSVWTGQPQVTMLTLNRLDRHDRSALIAQIAGGTALPDEVVDQIVDRTDGVPLFIEELTKSVLESGVPLVGIPTTLHDSLMARLDRLASVRWVAQIGAAIGREFSYALMRAVSRLPEDELRAAFARLVASELVFQRGTPPDALYTFKHALVQDAAHSSLLRSVRQQLHTQIAAALETDFPEVTENQPELLAQHYAEAGLIEKSVACWGKAGHRSAASSAMAEAAAQFQKGLDQFALLSDTPERRRQELEFSSALGAVLQAVKGHAGSETGQAYARARWLWEQLGFPSEFLHVPYGQSFYHVGRGELDLALRLDEDLLRLSKQRNDSAGLIMAHFSAGRDLMVLGKFASSRSHLEQAVALYDPIAHGSLVHKVAVHPRVAPQVFLGYALFCLGFPDQALERSNAAIAEARSLAHPPSLAASLATASRVLSLVGDNAALEERIEELVAVATEQGFSYWRGSGTIFRGWVRVKNGDLTGGMSLLRTGSAAFRATGTELFVPHYNALLAAAYDMAGQVEEAVTLLDEALQSVEETGERWFEPELNRQKGQLLLRQGYVEAAENLYSKALSIAEEQEGKLWELRTAASYARLMRDQGRIGEARELLAPIYAWFTEGFATKDLKDAKALLDELAA
jgi:class 3 adenylate cyclase/predicted ATPase